MGDRHHMVAALDIAADTTVVTELRKYETCPGQYIQPTLTVAATQSTQKLYSQISLDQNN